MVAFKDDPWTLEKCLTISCEMLQGISKPGLSPTLRTLAETLVFVDIHSFKSISKIILKNSKD